MSALKVVKDEFSKLANILTLFRIVLIPVVILLLELNTPFTGLMATFVFIFAGITDYFDGWVARRYNQSTVLGQFLDPLADKLLVMAILIVLAAQNRVWSTLVILLIAREITISGLRSIAVLEGYILKSDKLGKFKTTFQFLSISFLCVHYTYQIDFFFFTTKVNFSLVGNILLYVSLGYSLLSAFFYFKNFFDAMEEKQKAETL